MNQKVPHLVRVIGRSVRQGLHQTRFEIERIQRRRRRVPVIQNYMATHEVRGVHIGAGPIILKGWLNTDLEPQAPDIAYLDVTEPLPFPDNSIDFIFSEHLIEHVPHADGAYHLRESFRVLKPNGRIRVSTPDLQFLIDIYTRTEHTETQARYVRRTLDQAFPEYGFYNGAFVLNHFVKNWGHQFIYDDKTLPDALTRAGFRSVRRWQLGESDAPMLQNIEHHGDSISPEFNLMQSIVVEGTKSAAR
jgi:predicted SAM-dependent methyltransferase